MAMEITKASEQNGMQPTWKLLYEAEWEQKFNTFMLILAQQYKIELMIQIGNQKQPSPVIDFWREGLKGLSPQQMIEGLRGWQKTEQGGFQPTPEVIKENGLLVEATDRPRKVKNPKCPECSGSGFRKVLVDSRIHEGKKAQRVTDCFCVAIEYDGQSFKPEQKALPAAPEIDPKELLQRIGKKTGVELGREFPPRKDLDFNKNAEKLRQQAEILLKGEEK
jgi:hypothetical protein